MDLSQAPTFDSLVVPVVLLFALLAAWKDLWPMIPYVLGKTRYAEAVHGRIPNRLVLWWLAFGLVALGLGALYEHLGGVWMAREMVEFTEQMNFYGVVTFTLKEGKSLCRLARRSGVPIVSFSVKVLHETFREFREALRDVGDIAFLNSTGPADLKSTYGGVFFYGIHQVDPVIELFGNQVDTACIRPHGKGGIATLTYRKGPVVTINCVNNGFREFHSTAVGDKGLVDWTFGRDASPYIAGARLFVDMFRTGKEPIDHERMLAPIAVLEALAESLETGRTVKVARVALK